MKQIFIMLNQTDVYPKRLNKDGNYISIRNNDRLKKLEIKLETYLDNDIIIPVGTLESFEGSVSEFRLIDVIEASDSFNIAVGR
jgi:hypothetical protein